MGNHHRLFGYAEPIQSPAMGLECELVSNGLYCGDSRGYNDPRAKQLAQNAGDWELLLQLDSDSENTDMMWGDMGRLFFWIKKADLQKRNFENCWMISQCF